MSATELTELRKEAKKYLDDADERVIKMVHAMLEADAEREIEPNVLTPEQEAMLAERMEKYEKGQMKFSTWDEVEKRIISKAKNVL